MNLSKSPLRRVAGVAAGAVLGLAGIAVAATPAYATDAVIGHSVACDQKTGEWVVDWTVKGNAPEGVPSFQFTEVKNTIGLPEEEGKVDGFELGKDFATNEKHKASQRVAADKKYSRLEVKVAFDNGHAVEASNTVAFEGECSKDEPQPEPSESAGPSTPAEPETPEVDFPGEPIYEITCDTVTFGAKLDDDDPALTLKFETSKGEKRTLVVEPGTSDAATFSATEGFSFDVTISFELDGETISDTGTFEYEQPEGCDEGEGGGLPVTGAAAGGVAGGAAALLAVGGLLFFLARRRKVKFTA